MVYLFIFYCFKKYNNNVFYQKYYCLKYSMGYNCINHENYINIKFLFRPDLKNKHKTYSRLQVIV